MYCIHHALHTLTMYHSWAVFAFEVVREDFVLIRHIYIRNSDVLIARSLFRSISYCLRRCRIFFFTSHTHH